MSTLKILVLYRRLKIFLNYRPFTSEYRKKVTGPGAMINLQWLELSRTNFNYPKSVRASENTIPYLSLSFNNVFTP